MKEHNKVLVHGFIITGIIIVITICLLFSVSATITSYSCTGDNLKCFNPKIYNSTFQADLKNWWLNVLIKVDNATQPVKIVLQNPVKSYWTNVPEPTLKYSCDNWTWNIVKPTSKYVYEFTPNCKSFRIATFSAYDYTSVMNNIKLWTSKGIVKDRYETTPKGLKLPILEFGSDNPKYTVVMVYRQHSGEVYSDWYMYGTMKSLYKGNPILDDTRFLIFPLANPDGVYTGNVYWNPANQNLNGCWNKAVCVEVEIMKKYISQFNSTYGKIDLYLDWHGGNLAEYNINTIMYYTPKEKTLALEFKNKTSFKATSKGEGIGTSREYMRLIYNATSITPEIQMEQDAINNPIKMVAEGEKIPKLLHDWLVVQ